MYIELIKTNFDNGLLGKSIILSKWQNINEKSKKEMVNNIVSTEFLTVEEVGQENGGN